mgnify:CR=1 FL=1
MSLIKLQHLNSLITKVISWLLGVCCVRVDDLASFPYSMNDNKVEMNGQPTVLPEHGISRFDGRSLNCNCLPNCTHSLSCLMFVTASPLQRVRATQMVFYDIETTIPPDGMSCCTPAINLNIVRENLRSV